MKNSTFLASAVQATTTSESPSATGRESEFVAVGAGSETTSAEALLVTAYVLMWAIVFVFVYLSQKRQQKLDARLSELEKTLGRLDEGSARNAPPGAS